MLGMQRQMQQWIAALERIAATSHWVSKNRFDSFAPIRLNVAAQWLVDGVSDELQSTNH
jgi:phospholipase D1/2